MFLLFQIFWRYFCIKLTNQITGNKKNVFSLWTFKMVDWQTLPSPLSSGRNGLSTCLHLIESGFHRNVDSDRSLLLTSAGSNMAASISQKNGDWINFMNLGLDKVFSTSNVTLTWFGSHIVTVWHQQTEWNVKLALVGVISDRRKFQLFYLSVCHLVTDPLNTLFLS